MGLISRLWPARWSPRASTLGGASLVRPQRPIGPGPRGDRSGAASPAGGLDLERCSFEGLLQEFVESAGRGESPCLEEYVARLGPGRERDAIALIYEDYHRREAGASSPDPAEYVRRFPELGGRLARLFGLHKHLDLAWLMEWAGMLPAVGPEVGPCRLLRELGRGGFARVFLAEQTDLADRLVVLKVTHRPTAEPGLLARVRHPHIVEILWHEDDVEARLQLVAMPFLGGATLSEVLAERRRRGQRFRSGVDWLEVLDWVGAPEGRGALGRGPIRDLLGRSDHVEAVVWMVARLAEALEHARRLGVTHGDLKPSNILIAADGRPLLLDFNLSHDGLGGGFAGTSAGGTLAYMAPEALRAFAAGDVSQETWRPCDRHRADLYALGLILVECLSGDAPSGPEGGRSSEEQAAGLARTRAGDVPWPRRALREVPAALRPIVALCLAPEPADRYLTAGQLALDLDSLLGEAGRGLRGGGRTRLRRGRLGRRTRRVGVVAGMLLLLTGVAGAGAGYALSTRAAERVESLWSGLEPGVYRIRPARDTDPPPLRTIADDARRFLKRFGVLEDPEWDRRLDVRLLPGPLRADLAAWIMEQAYHLALAVAGDDRATPVELAEAAAALRNASGGTYPGPLLGLAEQLEARRGGERWLSSGATRALDPGLGWVVAYLRGVEAERVDPSAALAQYRRALAANPESYWAHYRAARTAYVSGFHIAALVDLEYCLSRSPRNPKLLMGRAVLRSRLGRADLALRDAEAALAIEPADGDTFHTLAWLRDALEQKQRLRDDLLAFEHMLGSRRGHEGWKQFFDAWRLIGLEAIFDREEAVFAAEQLEAAAAEDLDARLLLAIRLRRRGENEAALQEFDTILGAIPDHLWACHLRGCLRWKLRLYTAAAEDFDRVLRHPNIDDLLRHNAKSVDVYRRVAWDAVRTRSIEDTMEVLELGHDLVARFLQIHPGLPQAEKRRLWGEYFYSCARVKATFAEWVPEGRMAVYSDLEEAARYLPDEVVSWVTADPAFRSVLP